MEYIDIITFYTDGNVLSLINVRKFTICVALKINSLLCNQNVYTVSWAMSHRIAYFKLKNKVGVKMFNKDLSSTP